MRYNANRDSADINAVLAGDAMRVYMQDQAEEAAGRIEARFPRRTGVLASTVSAHTEMGGKKHDRWIGVAETDPQPAPYGAAVEFGNARRAGVHVMAAVATELSS